MPVQKLSATIDSETLDHFEQVRKNMGFKNRSKAVQAALKHFTHELKLKKLEKEYAEARGELSKLIEASKELQGKALESKFG